MAAKFTRTVSHTRATVKCINTKTLELTERTLELPDLLEEEEKILKAARRECATEVDIMVVAVINHQIESAKYEMTLATFLANATRID